MNESMAGMNRGMNNFAGRGQGMSQGPGHGGRGFGKNRNSVMDFSNTDDLSQLIHGCSHYLKKSEMSNLGGTQQKILGILKEYGDLTQRQLMEILHVKAGSLSEIIKKLEMKELIARKANPQDRRSMLISLTEIGAKQLSDCNNGDCGCDFAILTDEKKEQLRSILKELLNSWYE